MVVEARAQKIRIVSADPANPATSRYDRPEGTRILQGIAPDIVLLQQFNVGNDSTGIAAYVTSTFGAGFSYVRGSASGTGSIPTGIVSRYPILTQGEWDDVQSPNRDFTWACLDIPGDTNLWVVSVHFSTVANTRPLQASALVSLIQANIPASDYLVVGGIFNSDTRTETQFATLAAVVDTSGPHPADQNGNENTNSARTRPYDSLFANAAFRARQSELALGGGSFPNGLVVDTRQFTPLAALNPALLNDSAEISHMPVVKEFTIPTAPLRVTAVNFILSAPAHGTLTFTSLPGVTYQVQASSTLQAGSWSDIGSIPATVAETSVQIVAANPTVGQLTDPLLGTAVKRFYRIVQP